MSRDPGKCDLFFEDVFVRYSMNMRVGSKLTTKSEREKKTGLDTCGLMICVQLKTKRMKVKYFENAQLWHPR